MNIRSARTILAGYRPSGADKETSKVSKALAVAEQNASLKEHFDAQVASDRLAAGELQAIPLPDDARTKLRAHAEALLGKKGAGRISAKDPAMLAVGIGFLLLIGLLVWHMMGQAGVFPEEALKVGMEGARSLPSQYEEVEAKAGDLEDWLMLKGYDAFRVPPGLAKYDVVGVRIFRVEGEPVAVAAVPENGMFFMAFRSAPFEFEIPKGQWKTTEMEGSVIAVREDDGICFLIVMKKGSLADLQKVLDKADKAEKK